MNDRYLFRAKHSLESKKWHIGNLAEEPDGLYLRDNKNNIMVYIQDPSTICQCTGLKDKNGKLIWENDVLSISKKMDSIGNYYFPPVKYPANASVKWDLCAWLWETISKNKNEKYYISFPDAWCHYEAEIIGNIFDNPEFMYE